MSKKAEIAIVMGSKSDWVTMSEATQILDQFGLSYHVEVVSAHRTPDKLFPLQKMHKQTATKSLLPVQAEQPIYPV